MSTPPAPLHWLHSRVTIAIGRAEECDWAGETKNRWWAVAALEVQIARQTTLANVEGQIARIGAVTALLKADEPTIALIFASRYLSEIQTDALIGANTDSAVLERLVELRIEAEDRMFQKRNDE